MSTASPGATKVALTVASLGARSSFSIFMASTMTRMCPCATRTASDCDVMAEFEMATAHEQWSQPVCLETPRGILEVWNCTAQMGAGD